MKKIFTFFIILFFALPSFSQLLSWAPNFPQESTSPLVITLDAGKGNQGLLNYTPVTDVYVHIGVITNLSANESDWKYSKFTWATADALAQATSLGNNKWSYTIAGGLRAYFGITNVNETIQKIAILFRNGNGSKVQRNVSGADMYIPVYTTALATRFTVPLFQPTYNPLPETITKVVGSTIAIAGVSNNPATLRLYFNGAVVQTAAASTSISANPLITATGNQVIVIEANDGLTIKRDSIQFYVAGTVAIAALPAGVRDGINYDAGNTSGATLVLYAPGKIRVAVIGDLPGSNWQEQNAYQLNKTPDGNRWWIHLNGLTTGTEYSFQYLVDGILKIAEPYAEKIQDPYNDQYIPAATYPGLKPYPVNGTTGVVSILQTGALSYNWHNTNFIKPDKRNTVIYELLLRDFVSKHDWTTLRDSLKYLKNLGINVIELMPVNEFEGNNSWGYNPDFYFAPDKYYGPANTMKQFIDSCHSGGIAVVMDIALNHSFGLSPMVQLYWDAANNRPAANNPWFNPVATHPFNVGYDMNHESLATRYFVSRVMEHWLINYKIDGFRFDLSKGFTEVNSCTTGTCDTQSEINNWNNYDASRIAIWKRYYDTMQLKAPGAYSILEHFADNSEETELSNYGFLLWGNLNYSYNQASMGYSTGWNFENGIYSVRGWTNPALVTYMESHDEERLMYKNLQYGNSSGSYNIKTLSTGLKRMEMNGAFFFSIPGPKMIYEFGELGYDYSINFCQNGSIDNSCRTDSKPIRWDYRQSADRSKLSLVWSNLIKLRTNPLYSNLFASASQIAQDFTGPFKWLKVDQGSAHIMVIGNFDVVQQTGTVTFTIPGTWYDFLGNTSLSATGTPQSFTLQPGEYHVFLNNFVPLPVTITSFEGQNHGGYNLLNWSVNNEQNLAYYDLERSTDGVNFSGITKIQAAGKENYGYADDISNTFEPVYYYRLKTVDTDGNFKYSSVIKIIIPGKAASVTVSPNPFDEKLILNIESAGQDIAELTLSDISGRRLYTNHIAISTGINIFNIVPPAHLSAGLYILNVRTSAGTQSSRVIKGK